MKETLKNEISCATESILREKHLKYSVDNYETECEGEVISLTEIMVGENKITISDDFALVVISGSQQSTGVRSCNHTS